MSFELLLLQTIPEIALPRVVFVAINYIMIVVFVLLNLYLTVQIMRAYGFVIGDLFTGSD
jgi:hypothetical protein